MPLHQAIQRLLLVGARVESLPPAPSPQPPLRLLPLIAAIAPAHQKFDERAMYYGHRYRSGFWAIYLLSAIAVLCAVLPLALGWDSRTHALHPYAGLWAVAEVGMIATVSAIYWRGHRRDWQGEWLRTRTTAELTWYLPLVAPLVDFANNPGEGSWYRRVLDPANIRREPTTWPGCAFAMRLWRRIFWLPHGSIRCSFRPMPAGRLTSCANNRTTTIASPPNSMRCNTGCTG